MKRLLIERTRHLGHRVSTATEGRYRRAIARAAVVSFDVFDTALYRAVHEPADVFEIVAYRLVRKGLIEVDPTAFRSARIQAELDARRIAAERGFAEVTLSDIYVQFRAAHASLAVSEALEEELIVEAAVLVVNPSVKRAYDAAQASNKVIVFVSDTYFSKEFVEQRLRDAGYASNHELFASSTYNATKERGSLFDIVAAHAANGEAHTIVHLGDNRRADVVMARRRGLAAFWFRSSASHATRSAFDQALSERTALRLQSLARLTATGSEDERMLAALGYGALGLIFLGFTQWLATSLEAQPTELLLFCARDGYFIKALFDVFSIHAGYTSKRYFEVSRRALNVPSIVSMDERAIDILTSNNAALPLRQFFSRIGINLDDHLGVVAETGLAIEQEVKTNTDRSKLRQLFWTLSQEVLEHLALERPQLFAYCDSIGCFDAKSITVVDIGWGASLQASLATLLMQAAHKPALSGYYVSTDGRAKLLPISSGTVHSWMCHAGEPQRAYDIIRQGYWLMEIAFAAPHGSVLGYSNSEGKLSIKYQDYDPGSRPALAGALIQAHALRFAKVWNAIFNGLGPSLSVARAFQQLERSIIFPSHTQASFFGEIVHNGGLGDTSESQHIAKPPSLAKILRQPRILRQSYRESHWKRGFMTRLFRSPHRANIIMKATRLIPYARRVTAKLIFRK